MTPELFYQTLVDVGAEQHVYIRTIRPPLFYLHGAEPDGRVQSVDNMASVGL